MDDVILEPEVYTLLGVDIVSLTPRLKQCLRTNALVVGNYTGRHDLMAPADIVCIDRNFKDEMLKIESRQYISHREPLLRML